MRTRLVERAREGDDIAFSELVRIDGRQLGFDRSIQMIEHVVATSGLDHQLAVSGDERLLGADQHLAENVGET